MTELQIAIASGQASASQIQAHRVAGELRDPMKSYPTQHCKTTGMSCNRGCTSCTVADDEKPETLRETIDGAGDESAHVWCKVSDVRAALLDAERYRFHRTIGGRSWSDTSTGELAKLRFYDSATDAAIKATS